MSSKNKRYRDYKQKEYTKKEIKENDKNLYLYESTLDDSSTTYTKSYDDVENAFGIPTRKTNGRGDDTYFQKMEYKKSKKLFDEKFLKLKKLSEEYNNILFPTNFGQFSNFEDNKRFKNYIFSQLTSTLEDSKDFFSIYRK